MHKYIENTHTTLTGRVPTDTLCIGGPDWRLRAAGGVRLRHHRGRRRRRAAAPGLGPPAGAHAPQHNLQPRPTDRMPYSIATLTSHARTGLRPRHPFPGAGEPHVDRLGPLRAHYRGPCAGLPGPLCALRPRGALPRPLPAESGARVRRVGGSQVDRSSSRPTDQCLVLFMCLPIFKRRHGGVHVQEPDELGLGDGSGVMSAFWFTPSDITEFHRGTSYVSSYNDEDDCYCRC